MEDYAAIETLVRQCVEEIHLPSNTETDDQENDLFWLSKLPEVENDSLGLSVTIHEIQIIGDTAWAYASVTGNLRHGIRQGRKRSECHSLFVFKHSHHWTLHQYVPNTSLAA